MGIDELRQFSSEINAIARKHGITRVHVFGSVARGDSSAASDVDFLVEMQAGISLFGIAGFGFEVEQLLGRKVDVIPVSSLTQVKDERFVAAIQKEAIIL